MGMLSPVTEPALWLSADDVLVQAGGYAEIELGVEDASPAGAEEVYALGVVGLEAGWYTLSGRAVASGAKGLLVIHPPRRPRLTSPGRYAFTIQAVPSAGGPLLTRRVTLDVVPPGARERSDQPVPPAVFEPSRLLQYLPGIYAEDDFTNRFLQLFQSMLDPIQDAVDTTSLCFDPAVAPPGMLDWLASWLGISLAPCPDEASRRLLIRQAVELARWRGTRRGLEGELRLRLGGKPLIVENFDGLRLGHDAALGLNTRLGRPMDGGIAVTMVHRAGADLNPDTVSGLVDQLKPAYTAHTARLAAWPTTEQQGVQDG